MRLYSYFWYLPVPLTCFGLRDRAWNNVSGRKHSHMTSTEILQRQPLPCFIRHLARTTALVLASTKEGRETAAACQQISLLQRAVAIVVVLRTKIVIQNE